jgi:hypothetical protein
MALSSVSVVALKSRRAITRLWMMALENSKVLLKNRQRSIIRSETSTQKGRRR